MHAIFFALSLALASAIQAQTVTVTVTAAGITITAPCAASSQDTPASTPSTSSSTIVSSSAANVASSIVLNASSSLAAPSTTAASPVNTNVAAAWDQCDGQGWTPASIGPLACPFGYSCVPKSIYYSQCLPVGFVVVETGSNGVLSSSTVPADIKGTTSSSQPPVTSTGTGSTPPIVSSAVTPSTTTTTGAVGVSSTASSAAATATGPFAQAWDQVSLSIITRRTTSNSAVRRARMDSKFTRTHDLRARLLLCPSQHLVLAMSPRQRETSIRRLSLNGDQHDFTRSGSRIGLFIRCRSSQSDPCSERRRICSRGLGQMRRSGHAVVLLRRKLSL